MRKQPEFFLAIMGYIFASILVLYATLVPAEIGLTQFRVLIVLGAAGWWLAGVEMHTKSHSK